MRVPVNMPMPLMRLRPHAHRVMSDCQFVLVEMKLMNVSTPVEPRLQPFALLNNIIVVTPHEGVPPVQPVEYAHALIRIESAPEQVARVDGQIILRIGHLLIVP